MSIHVALLRGINVTGHNMIAMADLREMLEKIGFTGAKTLLQSGNVVFNCKSQKCASLELRLEQETQKHLVAKADYIVRTADEWEEIVARNPFPKEAKIDPSHLTVMCLKGIADPKAVKILQAWDKGPEVVRADQRSAAAGHRHLYISYPNGIGKSKLTHGLLEKTLALRGTVRNWNTVLKLAAMLNAGAKP